MTQVDMSILAQNMLKWEQLRKELDYLEAQIGADVLAVGKTQVVGNVRATYNKGRDVFERNYESAVALNAIPKAVIETHTRTVVDWKAVCEEAGLEVPATLVKTGEPSVSIKLLG